MTRNTFVVLVLVFSAAGFIIYLLTAYDGALSSEVEGTALTNPVSQLVKDKNLSIGGRVALKTDLEEFAMQSIARGAVSDYGIYYRELISGPVIALRESSGFFPASLLKIPVAMWYYKQAEIMPSLLDEEVDFPGPPGTSIEYFPPKETIVPGNRYTIRELIRFMLAESDNDATHILTEYAGGREVINSVYEDLGIRDVENYDTYVIDTQTYAAFFRVLFNAEYLDEASSRAILGMLAESSFDQGIEAGVPAGMTVSHKFGERTIDSENNINQLHDCGIVYAPENPYMLCVMTQGDDYTEMAAFITEVSRRIYKAASSDAP